MTNPVAGPSNTGQSSAIDGPRHVHATVYDSASVNMNDMENAMHGGSHRVRNMSDTNGNGAWHSAWISALIQGHAITEQLEGTLRANLGDELSSMLADDIRQIREMVEIPMNTRLKDITTGTALKDPVADGRRLRGIKLPGDQDKNGVEGQKVCSRLSKALLIRAGYDRALVEACFNGTRRPDIPMIMTLMRMLGVNSVVYEKAVDSQGGFVPAASRIHVAAREGSRLANFEHGSGPAWRNKNLINEFESVAVLVYQNGRVNLAIEGT